MREKMTKAEMIAKLEGVETKDKTLKGQIDYTLKKVKENIKNVTSVDLAELLAQVSTLPAVETSPKPKLTTKNKASTPAPKEEKAPAKSKEKPKMSEKKKDYKKIEEGKVITAPQAMKNGRPEQAKYFPKKITLPDGTDILSCYNAYTTHAEVVEAINEGKTLYFACYWTAKHLKQFDYAGVTSTNPPKAFPHDLDIMSAIVACENIKRIWAMSLYTEALFAFESEDFAYVKDNDPKTDEPYKVRVAEGLEFEIYRPKDEEIIQLDENEDEDEE